MKEIIFEKIVINSSAVLGLSVKTKCYHFDLKSFDLTISFLVREKIITRDISTTLMNEKSVERVTFLKNKFSPFVNKLCFSAISTR